MREPRVTLRKGIKAVFALILFITGPTRAQTEKRIDPIPVFDGRHWGFIDNSGSVVIPFRYDDAEPFSDGVAVVRSGGKFGYIDDHGEWVIHGLKYALASSFSEGLAAVGSSAKDGFEWGYIDKSGAIKIPLQFYTAEPFSDGLALVSLYRPELEERKQYGYIDHDGKFVIPAKFGQARSFSEGLALVSPKADSPPTSYIDNAGNLVFSTHYSFADSFSEGLAAVELGNEYGYIDKTGSLVIDVQFKEASSFHEGLARVRTTDYYGFIDSKGQFVIKPTFFDASDFSGGVAVAESLSDSGIIDTHGKVLVPFPLRAPGLVGDGVFRIRHEVFGWDGYLNSEGKVIYIWPEGVTCPVCRYVQGHGQEDERKIVRFESDPSKATVYLVPVWKAKRHPELIYTDSALQEYRCTQSPTPVDCHMYPDRYWAVFVLTTRKCKLMVEVHKNDEHEKYKFVFPQKNDDPACQ